MKLKYSITFCAVFSILLLFHSSCRRKGVRSPPNKNQRQAETTKEKKSEKSDKGTTIKISPEINLVQPTENKGVQLNLKNTTTDEIYISVIYMNLEGDWVVRGWWTLQGGGEYLIKDIKADNNSEIYFYGDNADGIKSWSGLYESEPPLVSITDDEFEYKLKFSSQLDKLKMYNRHFFKGRGMVKSGIHTEVFDYSTNSKAQGRAY